MAYVKTTWNSGAAPGISAANLNNLETQYDEGATDAATHAALATVHQNAPGLIATHAALTATHGVGEVANAADLRQAMKPPVVRWVIPGWAWFTGNNVSAVANRTYYTPIYVPEDTTYDRIGIYVVTGDGAGGVADLRIFEWNTGVPGDLVLSAGTVSTNAGTAKEITISQALTRGYYFLAVRCDQTPSLSGAGIDRGIGAPVGGVVTTNHQGGPDGVVLYDDAAYSDPAGAVDGVENILFVLVRLREA